MEHVKKTEKVPLIRIFQLKRRPDSCSDQFRFSDNVPLTHLTHLTEFHLSSFYCIIFDIQKRSCKLFPIVGSLCTFYHFLSIFWHIFAARSILIFFNIINSSTIKRACHIHIGHDNKKIFFKMMEARCM